MQPDLGTALVLVPVAVVGAFFAGIEWKHMAVGLRTDRAIDSGWLEYAAPPEAVPAATY